ncbi:hypothetical protein GCM10009736_10160 [Actinomadura bangladeshensis]|uniref:HD domain-containing protein n=1 Tax=Actinomadura bangladeshensis TaxID=453573 RepID=A0A4R4PDG6_9ACTN|nr:HD domain-containing protein [Actinomadura bangladeshensis]
MVRRLDAVSADEWRERRAASTGPRQVAGPLLDLLRTSATLTVFEADHLIHQLQTATRAYRAGADDELVVAALFHDVAELTAGPAHGKVAAELLRPYVRDDVYHVVRTHSDFQGRYYYEHMGLDRTTYLRWADEPWYGIALCFSDDWDQAAFDPGYDTRPLSFFEPMVHRVLAEPFRSRASA